MVFSRFCCYLQVRLDFFELLIWPLLPSYFSISAVRWLLFSAGLLAHSRNELYSYVLDAFRRKIQFELLEINVYADIRHWHQVLGTDHYFVHYACKYCLFAVSLSSSDCLFQCSITISNSLKRKTKDSLKIILIKLNPFVSQFIFSLFVYFVCPSSNLRVVRVLRNNHSTMGLLLLILLGYDYVFTVVDTIHYSFVKWRDGMEIWLYSCLPFATIYYILFILFFVNNLIELWRFNKIMMSF